MNPFERFSAPMEKIESRHVPESELRIESARSSGPGGQKVNKTSSKAVLFWNIDASATFTPEEKIIIKQRLANRINKRGELYLDADSQRSQHRNRSDVLELLDRLVTEVLKPRTPRVPTKPTKGSKERRLEDKKLQARKKEARKIED